MPNAAEQLSTGSKLARVSPSEAGISSRAVAALLEDARTRQLDLHDLLIYHRGAVGLELYKWPYRTAQPRIMHSIAKSFTSVAIGLALEEGALHLDDKVISFFPSQLPAIVDDKLAAMTVEDLLTMRTGQAAETSGARWRGLKTSWIAEFFKIPLFLNAIGAVSLEKQSARTWASCYEWGAPQNHDLYSEATRMAMPPEPLINTVIPTYWRSPMLRRAIRSVLDQT